MGFLAWCGIAFLAVISIVVPRTAVAILALNILEYGIGSGIF